MFQIEGYNFIYKSRKTGVQGGGVGIYIRKDLKFKLVPEYSIFIDKVIETIFVEIEVNEKKKILVSSVYRPNGPHPNLTHTQQLTQFCEMFSNILAEISTADKAAYIYGDINIDLIKFQSHEKTSEFIENCFANGFLQLITRPTRCANGAATLIDHLYTNVTNNCIESGILTTTLSDHFAIFSQIVTNRKLKMPNFFYSRNMSEDNKAKFKESLDNCHWGEIYGSDCPQGGFDLFFNKFNSLYEIHFPLKKIKFNKNFHKIEPFMTQGLLISRKEKIVLSNISIKHPSAENKAKFKLFRGLYNKLIRVAKKKYFEESLEHNQLNLKKTWQILREAIRKKNDKSSGVSEIKIDGNLIEDGLKIAGHFNDYFTSIAGNIAEEINPSDRPPDSFMENLDLEFEMGVVTSDRIIEIVGKMEAKNSKDMSGISNNLVKYVISTIAAPLSHIFSNSVTTGLVPSQFKEAKVIPIYKLKTVNAEERQNISNYRPISLLSIFSKILEKVVANSLTTYLIDNNILYDNQFGYQKGKSTSLPMLKLVDFVSKAMNEGDIAIGIFCDLRKAFDTCSHSILYKKLEKIGVKGKFLDWFKSYLSNRKQFVSINEHSSELKDITNGVPQGSILGPILFLIYINDLNKVTDLLSLLFADDTSILISGKNLNEMVFILNEELHKICTWFRANQLSLHPFTTPLFIVISYTV